MSKQKMSAGKKKNNVGNSVSVVRQAKHGGILTILFAILSFFWVSPILVVLLNSFKRKAYIFKNPFGLSNVPLSSGFEKWAHGLSKTFVGGLNYANALKKTNFVRCFGYSFFITLISVVLIVVCCSMCAWYITRVQTAGTKLIYLLCMFSMIVPFQMVMFTLSKLANILHLATPMGICIVYLGFGAGLAVFMFCGFVKSIPLEIEEAAMIDGCTPLRTFFSVVLPIMKPTYISVGILETMWIWNDFLLPYLVLDLNKYKTISIVIQYMKGSYGRVDMGAIMAALILAVIPVIIFYLSCQKHIIKGVAAGAVKG